MRLPFLAAIALAACSADPVLLPDAGPCSSACGPGTVCMAGACVAVDGGALDVVAVGDAGPDVQAPEDRGSALDVPIAVADAGPADTGADAGVDVPPDTYGACLVNGIMECDGRNVMTQLGEVDGGRTYHCGGCGNTCPIGDICLRCRCTR
ncbi:MAG: hypothetical protein Q8S73_37875 [Deltaproteobacteria bacterium]|nr:hypothetical protein [Myxococcales bacterium]MDP3219931.1 hypothetical protein [Deltaproteobacteria bacterium]